jgi:V/A-type H+-transporting ATPase subunit K
LIFLALVLVALAFVFLSNPVAAQSVTTSSTTSTTAASSSAGEKFLAAGLAFGLAALGAGIGVGTSGSAAIAAVTEKAEVRTTALIFVVLAEAIAIYGFAIAFIILGSSG